MLTPFKFNSKQTQYALFPWQIPLLPHKKLPVQLFFYKNLEFFKKLFILTTIIVATFDFSMVFSLELQNSSVYWCVEHEPVLILRWTFPLNGVQD